jgi:prepilin-type N-terminal cleavage/methylation domain-containing protein
MPKPQPVYSPTMLRAGAAAAPCPAPLQHQQRGFSLIEVIIILLLLGLLAATFGSKLFAIPSTEAALERTRMAARISYAREQGLLQGATETEKAPCLSLTQDTVSYSNLPPMIGEKISETLTGCTLSVSPEAGKLCFSPQGGLTENGSVTLTFSPPQGEALTLVVEGGTGYAH